MHNSGGWYIKSAGAYVSNSIKWVSKKTYSTWVDMKIPIYPVWSDLLGQSAILGHSAAMTTSDSMHSWSTDSIPGEWKLHSSAILTFILFSSFFWLLRFSFTYRFMIIFYSSQSTSLAQFLLSTTQSISSSLTPFLPLSPLTLVFLSTTTYSFLTSPLRLSLLSVFCLLVVYFSVIWIPYLLRCDWHDYKLLHHPYW